MKQIGNTFLLLLLMVYLAAGVSAQSLAPKAIPQQIIVRLDAGAPIDSILSQAGITAQILDSLAQQETFLLEIPGQLALPDVLEALEGNPAVTFVHPNYQVALPEVNQVSISFPDENRPPLISGSSPESYFGQPAVYDHGLDSAGLIADGAGQIVAVIDNGIATAHPLFVDRLVSGYDFVSSDTDPTEDSGLVYGHGTFVSGLIALSAPAADVMPVRAFNGEGLGDLFDVVDAINYAVANGATVINMSFNLYSDVGALRTAINDARAAGVVLVASVGNDSTATPSYPASYPGVIAVSSIDTLEAAAGFTNYGSYVDVCAPGVDLYSSLAGEYEWGIWSGSSFSAALVTGVAALVNSFAATAVTDMSEHIRLSSRQELLSGSVVPQDDYYGWGAVDAWHAVFSLDRGDWDLSGELDPVDISIVADHLFYGVNHPHIDRADMNCDEAIDGIDLATMIGILYGGATASLCFY